MINIFTKESIIPFGKYKGSKLSEIPPSYLLWIYEQNKAPKNLRRYIADNIQTIRTEANK
jgi:uncharacterized protein (DUF3820 family)